jgi:hypothetical protein
MEGVSLLEILIWVTLSVQILSHILVNVYKNITKNNNILSLAIQNKNIKTNISHPLPEKKYNPNFKQLF